MKKLFCILLTMALLSGCSAPAVPTTEPRAGEVLIQLSDEGIEYPADSGIHTANDIIYYEDGHDETYGEGESYGVPYRCLCPRDLDNVLVAGRTVSSERVANGTMAGHVGFAESCGAMAEAWGWKIEKFEQQMSAIVTDVDRKSPYGFAAAGQVAGVNMTGQAWVDGEVKLDMYHPQQIEPEQVGVQTGDYVIIKGTPNVNMVNSPEIDGGIGTIAMCANMIPQVINAEPGLHTMLTLPVPRAIMGDMRDRIDPEKKIVK